MKLFKIDSKTSKKVHIFDGDHGSLCNTVSGYPVETKDGQESTRLATHAGYLLEFFDYTELPKDKHICPSCVLAAYESNLFTLELTEKGLQFPMGFYI